MKKEKIVLEYPIQATSQSLFRAFSTANGLREWFADNADITGNIYVFFWNKLPHHAVLISSKENQHVRFFWSEDPSTYFEFRIIHHDLTGDNSLVITDFADSDDRSGSIELWNNQVEKLKRSIGSAKK